MQQTCGSMNWSLRFIIKHSNTLPCPAGTSLQYLWKFLAWKGFWNFQIPRDLVYMRRKEDGRDESRRPAFQQVLELHACIHLRGLLTHQPGSLRFWRLYPEYTREPFPVYVPRELPYEQHLEWERCNWIGPGQSYTCWWMGRQDESQRMLISPFELNRKVFKTIRTRNSQRKAWHLLVCVTFWVNSIRQLSA